MYSASVHRGIIPVLASFIGALLSLAAPIAGQAAEKGRSLTITRQVTNPTQGPISGTEYKIELQMTLTGERLTGTGTVSMRIISGQGPWEYAGTASVQAEGTLVGDDVSVSVTSPKSLSLTETRGGTISYPFSEVKEFARFDGHLRDGKYEATETAPTASGISLLVVTKMDTGAAATGNIVVTKKRDLLVGGAIPGSAGVRRYHYNTLTFTLPDVPALRGDRSIHVAAEVQSSGGRLFKDRPPDHVFSDKEGSREVWWQEGVVPGAEQTFYYAWTAAPPSGAPINEVVTVKVLSPANTDLEGTVSFEVGIDLKVVEAGPLKENGGETEVTKRLPVRIAIEDGFHAGKDVAALLAELDVAPVLKVEHASYDRPKFMGFVVDVFGFDIFNWGEWVMATQMDLHAKDPKKRPSAFYYEDYAWNVGSGGVLGGPETEDFPQLFPRVLGTFGYSLDIAGLTFGAVSKPTSTLAGKPIALPDPKSEATPLTVEVTAVPAAEGAFGLLVTCVQAVSDAFGPNPKPTQKLKAVWQILGCLKQAGFATASGATSHEGVELNATAMMAKEKIEKQTRGGTRASDAPLKEVQALLAQGPGGQVVLLESAGLASLAATSDADGRLSEGPASINLGKLAAKDAALAREAAESYAPAKRIQHGKLYTAIALAPGETLTLDLAGRGEPGEIIAISKNRIKRQAYPAGNWRSSFEIAPDGTLKGVSAQPGPKAAADAESIEIAQSPAEDLWQKLKEHEIRPKQLDGTCKYADVPGTARITSVEKTEKSAHQATVTGDAGYQGLEVRYRFEPQTPLADADAQAFAEATHVFQLANSWYPGPRYVEKYGLTEGRTLPSTLRIRTEGSCPPHLITLSGVDPADYFETAK